MSRQSAGAAQDHPETCQCGGTGLRPELGAGVPCRLPPLEVRAPRSKPWRLAPSVAWVLVVIPSDRASDPRITVRHSEPACYRVLREAEDADGEFDSIADGAALLAAFAEHGTRVLIERREFTPNQVALPDPMGGGDDA